MVRNNVEQIEVPYVYLIIPTDYVCTYHKILIALSNIGKELIDDCNGICKSTNKIIIECWSLFQSAIACRQLGDIDKANFFIDYINKQLKLIVKNTEDGNVILPIDNEGKLKAIVSCDNNNPTFSVDVETGRLYRKWKEEQIPNKEFEIKDNNLIVSKDEQ